VAAYARLSSRTTNWEGYEMAEKIRVGIVGANPTRSWALDTHLPALHGLPDFEIVAVATTRLESAEETARNWNVPHAYGDSAELFADPEVDVAVISVKVPYHLELVSAALEANKHVVCEWPLGVNAKEAEILADLATSKGLQNVIGLQGRMSPIGNYVRQLVAEGYVGEVLDVSLHHRHRGFREIPETRSYTVDRANGANTLTLAGGHSIDFLRYLVGDLGEMQGLVAVRNPVVKVIETGEELSVNAPDVVVAAGRLVSGAYATIDLQAGPPHTLGSRLKIEGTDGVLLIESTSALQGGDDALTLAGAKADEQLHPLEVPPSLDQVPLTVPSGRPRNVAGLYLALAAALAGGGHAKPDFADALSLHRLLEAIETAATTGPPRTLG
jgi:predicted dehydrogenase